MSEPNIEVLLTDENEFECFKLIFRARRSPDAPDEERVPLEILLHTTQAIDLFHKLAIALSAYMERSSAELLRMKHGIEVVR